MLCYAALLMSTMLIDHQEKASGKPLEGKAVQTSTIAISLTTDHKIYAVGDPIRIVGKVLNGSGFVPNLPVTIVVNQTSNSLHIPLVGGQNELKSPRTTDNITTTTSRTGFFSYNTTIFDVGDYKITAFAKPDGKQENAFVVFHSTTPFLTLPFYMFYIALAFFIILLFVMVHAPPVVSLYNIPTTSTETKAEHHNRISFARFEVVRFFCITGIVVAIMVALVYSEVQLGANSPIGFVRQHPGKLLQNMTTSQWVINIGGDPADNYAGGIQIPSYVVIFGILGGYLRYLYGLRFLYGKGKKEDPKSVDPEWGDIEVTNPLALFKHSLRSLALIFLAPLLAIGIWFIVVQGGVATVTGKFAIAALSLTIGLITEEAAQALIGFARNLLAGIKAIAPREETKGMNITTKFPEDGYTGVPIASTIKVTFSEVIDKTTINAHSFRVRDDSNNEIGGTIEIGPDGKTASFKPAELARSTRHIVTVTTEVKDIKGNTLPSAEIWSFITEGGQAGAVSGHPSQAAEGPGAVSGHPSQAAEGPGAVSGHPSPIGIRFTPSRN